MASYKHACLTSKNDTFFGLLTISGFHLKQHDGKNSDLPSMVFSMGIKRNTIQKTNHVSFSIDRFAQLR